MQVVIPELWMYLFLHMLHSVNNIFIHNYAIAQSHQYASGAGMLNALIR